MVVVNWLAGCPCFHDFAGIRKMVSLLNLLDFSIRDAFVIPFAVQIGLYIGKQILQTVLASRLQVGCNRLKQNNNIGEL